MKDDGKKEPFKERDTKNGKKGDDHHGKHHFMDKLKHAMHLDHHDTNHHNNHRKHGHHNKPSCPTVTTSHHPSPAELRKRERKDVPSPEDEFKREHYHYGDDDPAAKKGDYDYHYHYDSQIDDKPHMLALKKDGPEGPDPMGEELHSPHMHRDEYIFGIGPPGHENDLTPTPTDEFLEMNASRVQLGIPFPPERILVPLPKHEPPPSAPLGVYTAGAAEVDIYRPIPISEMPTAPPPSYDDIVRMRHQQHMHEYNKAYLHEHPDWKR